MSRITPVMGWPSRTVATLALMVSIPISGAIAVRCPATLPATFAAALLHCAAPAQVGGLDPLPEVTGITVTPANATLSTGDSAQFGAIASLSDGSSGPAAVSWSATRGAISSGGVFRPDTVTGSVLVVARSTDDRFADTSVVVVAPDTVVGPPPPPGMVLLTEGFDNPSVSTRGWYDNTGPAITTATPHGGSGALEMAFAVGGKTATQGGALRHLFTASDRVYVRYWVQYSSNWVGSGQSYHPHEVHVITDQDHAWVGPSVTHLTTYIEHNYRTGGGVPLLAIQDALNIDVTRLNVDLTNVTEQRAVSGCNGTMDGIAGDCYMLNNTWRNAKEWRATAPSLLPTPGPGYKANWHQVEVYFQLNTIQNGRGAADGVAQYWFDGRLLIDRQDVLFRTAQHPTMRFNQFVIAPYIGDGSPSAQTMWVDDLVVATGRVP